MADFADGRIHAFVGPPELGAKDDLETVVVDFISGAEATLDIAVQEIDSEPIAQAILDARFRGVSVRVFLEHSYLQADLTGAEIAALPEDRRRAAQWEEARPRPDFRTNRDIFTALLRCDVEVHSDFNRAIFHQKFIVRDYRTKARPTSALLTGSTNFTSTDTHANLNHVVIFDDHDICNDYAGEFAQMSVGSFGRQRHGDPPKYRFVGGVPVKVLFAPDHTPELEIMKQINRCTKRLDFAIFTFSGSSGIDDSMIMVKRAGLDVRGAIDPGQGSFGWAPTRRLHDAGIDVFMPRRREPFRKLHHKLMVIDDDTVIAGSFNYTGDANDYNDENIFVIGDPGAGAGDDFDPKESRRIARFFRKEIDRIVDDLSDPYEP